MVQVKVLLEETVSAVKGEIHIVIGDIKGHIGPDQEVGKGDQGETDLDQEAVQNQEEVGLGHQVEEQGAEKGDLNQEVNRDQEVEEGNQEADPDHQMDQELVEKN